MKQKSGNVYFYASLLAERETDKETLSLLQRGIDYLKHRDRDVVNRALSGNPPTERVN